MIHRDRDAHLAELVELHGDQVGIDAPTGVHQLQKKMMVLILLDLAHQRSSMYMLHIGLLMIEYIINIINLIGNLMK